ncbi:MAG: carboxypeptidase-like regulatory domain-containing protein [Candidatus Acidiferrum sp.]
MSWRQIGSYLRLLCVVAWLAAASVAAASEYHGRVTFGGLPVPGATVTATQGGKAFTTITDTQGIFSFSDLTDGTWTIEVAMTGFAAVKQDVVVAPNGPVAKWELKMLPLEQMKAEVKTETKAQTEAVPSSGVEAPENKKEQTAAQENIAPGAKASSEEANQLSNDGLLINGSQNNGAASPFGQIAAFGNNRNGGNGLYTGGVGLIWDNSALDARPFSLSGLNTPKAAYNRVTGVATLGGPFRIPHLLHNGPYCFVGYQWTRDRDATTDSALVPDLAERQGNFSQAVNALGQAVQIFDPTTGLPFQNNIIPPMRISTQAKALLNLYPMPNISGNSRYNYQVPLISDTHQDALQSRFDKTINPKNQIYGDFAFLSTRTGNPNLFGFLDTTDLLGVNTGAHWAHRLNQRLFIPHFLFDS